MDNKDQLNTHVITAHTQNSTSQSTFSALIKHCFFLHIFSGCHLYSIKKNTFLRHYCELLFMPVNNSRHLQKICLYPFDTLERWKGRICVLKRLHVPRSCKFSQPLPQICRCVNCFCFSFFLRVGIQWYESQIRFCPTSQFWNVLQMIRTDLLPRDCEILNGV